MKLCSIENCDRKHHGKGYCKKHHTEYIMKEYVKTTICAVEGCEKPHSLQATKLGLCDMHYTRLKRNGSTDLRKRERDIKSIMEELLQSKNPLQLEISSRTSWSIICKEHYGDKCSVCGWNEATCDTHHRIPRKDGGKNTIANGIILCPNHHRTYHKVLREG